MQQACDNGAPGKRTALARRSNGFTLVELLVTIAVAAILLAIATPSFTAVINNNRLTSAANEMVATIQTGRMEAVRRNARTTVCSSANEATCGGAGAWIVLDNANNVLRVSKFNPNIKPSAAVSTFIFRADGLARATATSGLLNTDFRFCINTTSPVQNSRRVSIGSGSRISTDSETFACP